MKYITYETLHIYILYWELRPCIPHSLWATLTWFYYCIVFTGTLLSRQINLLFIIETSPETLKHFNRQFIPQDSLNPSPQNSHLALSPVLNYYILIFTLKYLTLNFAPELQTMLCRAGVLSYCDNKLSCILSTGCVVVFRSCWAFNNIIYSIHRYSMRHVLLISLFPSYFISCFISVFLPWSPFPQAVFYLISLGNSHQHFIP